MATSLWTDRYREMRLQSTIYLTNDNDPDEDVIGPYKSPVYVVSVAVTGLHNS